MAIHVCSLARLPDTVLSSRASHVVTVMGNVAKVVRPAAIHPDNHLVVSMDDIHMPMDGFVAPCEDHVQKIIAFARRWDRAAPMVVHCWAGISRSTATAFTAACALNPDRPEEDIAQAIRRGSLSARPNRLIVAIADDLLSRKGRMIRAIEAIGSGDDAMEGVPFVLALHEGT